jgi:hypothetical protein
MGQTTGTDRFVSHFGRIDGAGPLLVPTPLRPFKPKVAGSNLVGRMLNPIAEPKVACSYGLTSVGLPIGQRESGEVHELN